MGGSKSSKLNVTMTAPEEVIESIPGTVHLVDLQHTLHFRHAKGDTSDIVLVPAPSDDPEDPLNWTPRRKLLSIICICAYTFFTSLASSTIFSVLVPLATQTGVSISTLVEGTGYMFLFFAWGLLVWQPASFRFGRRIVCLISCLGTIGTSIWSVHISTNGQWIARCIVTGFFQAPIEALPETVINDVFFTHERGFYMGLYVLSVIGANSFTPVISGFIAEYQGWQWVFYWPAIFFGFLMVFLFLLLEETSYIRKTPGTSTESLPRSSDPAVVSDSEKNPAAHSVTASESGEVHHVRKTYWQKLSIFHYYPGQSIWEHDIRSLKYLSWPVIFYAGFSYGSYLIWYNVFNNTASLVLSAPPYNFSSSMVGLSFLAAALGSIVGCVFSGPFSDWLTLKLARRNNGIMEAEQRLLPFAICVLLVPGCLILWGVGAAHEIHWFGLLVSNFFLTVTLVFGGTLSINYMVDSYHEIMGDAIVSIILVRNTMYFAVSYGLTPWLDMGYQNCFISAAFIGMVACSVFIIMIFFGKKFRTQSADKYWKIVRSDRAKIGA
ncbi:hypothetical protein CLAIMM_04681 [Cladophialophora immunda]|nr:hypothetical protein CLAIMM_04681 [Cladophialophora immunda]